MKNILKSLLIFGIFVAPLRGASNKTFFLPRSHGVNLAMEYTTWHELLQIKSNEDYTTHFQLTAFYMDSREADDLGRYFGVSNKFNFTVNDQAAQDVIGRWIIHARNSANQDWATIKLSPKQNAYGARLDFYQGLNKILDGLYFKAALPIVNVDNDLRMHITAAGADPEQVAAKAVLEDYFKGRYAVAANGNNGITGAAGCGQAALTHGKIDGSQNTTGIADIDLVLGYKAFDKEKYHVAVNLGLTIPTGTTPTGEYLFEAVVGNGNHWGLGAGLDFMARLWGDDEKNIKLTGAANYRYLFESTEKRTLGLQYGNAPFNWQHYVLAGAPGDTVGTPGANEITLDLNVTPGSQFDAIIALAYNNRSFTFDLGYNLFWKDRESVKTKGWSDRLSALAIIEPTLNFNVALDANTPGHWIDGNYLLSKDHANVDRGAAATPSQMTHKIYGGIGYIFKDCKYPVMLNFSAHYEFASDDGIENWAVWGKLGVAF